MRVFVNGIHAIVGGGKSILWNLAQTVSAHAGVEWVILAPDKKVCAALARPGLQFIDGSSYRESRGALLRFYGWQFRKVLADVNPHVILNLGDIPFRDRRPQVYLFDWPYAIYPESEVWDRIRGFDYWGRQVKWRLIRRALPCVTLALVQTDAAASRFSRLYPTIRTTVVPNAIAIDHFANRPDRPAPSADGRINLLCLSHYYVHKNLEILLDVAEEWRRRGEHFHLTLTIAPDQHRRASDLLNQIQTRGLANFISTVGPVELSRVPELYAAAHGLVLPTLLESFSGTYLEAMAAMKPVFTSDRDFAHAVCGEHAYYFDPLSGLSICDAIERAFSDESAMQVKILNAHRWAAEWPTWPQVAKRIAEITKQVAVGA